VFRAGAVRTESEAAEGFRTIASWLSPQSALPDVCGDAPCYIAGWNGPGS
jgi:hypothetical protein